MISRVVATLIGRKNRSSLFLILSVVCLVGTLFLPIWSIGLSAPQYSGKLALGMNVWISEIKGAKEHDIQNINILNHYIGMKVIDTNAIPELKYMKYIVWYLIAVGLLATLLPKRSFFLWFFFASLAFVGLMGVYDLFLWESDYGHNLGQNAAIHIPGMSYQPPLIGRKHILNITATSWPHLGGLLAILSGGFSLLSLTSFYVAKKEQIK